MDELCVVLVGIGSLAQLAEVSAPRFDVGLDKYLGHPP